MNELIYVYCISANIPQLDKIEGYDRLGVFCGDQYYAVTKKVSADEYSEENLKKNFLNLSWIEAQTRNHVQVISQIMESITVIPCKFGTIFTSEETLKEFLYNYSDFLHDNLQILKGKEEWSVKIYCNRTKLSEQIAQLSKTIHDLEVQIRSSSPGKSFLLKKKRMDLVEAEVDQLSSKHAQMCFDSLKKISELNTINKLLSNELTGREEDMILNATFLVKKKKVDEFIKMVDFLKKEYESDGFELECSGPWPSFSFISINNTNAELCNK